ncbi:MAG TPA: GNAT family N-acetyltransferase [Bacteroidales bacterium]|nr:GNAT family N-acetyltransferase [Bacteroidales bacterium]
MKLIEVHDKKSAKQFLDVARILYKEDKNWVCPLDRNITSIFNREENPFFAHGDATRWVLVDDTGKLIGRVAAFLDEKKSKNFDQVTGGMGFYECINNMDAAFMLFDACKDWLQEKGALAMDGPINFSENDNFWGLLVEGFIQPSYGMNYNFPYYKDQFEAYGFYKYYEQVSNHLDLREPFPERFWKIADRIMARSEYQIRHFEYKYADKYISDLISVYDKAWVYHEHFQPLERQVVLDAMKKAKPILVEEFIWFAYHNDEPIAFLVMLPDVNQILKHLNGKLHLWNKLRFIYYRWRKTMTRTRITVMGVAPQYQRHGIESAIFKHMDMVMKTKPHIDTIEMSWVGDFNTKMRALHEAVGGKFGMRHWTMRKLFDESMEAKRSKIIELGAGLE